MTLKQQVEKLTDFVEDHAREELKVWDRVAAQIADIHGVLFGDIEHPEQPGIFERIRILEGHVARWNRVLWLALGSVVASIVALVFNLLKSSPPK